MVEVPIELLPDPATDGTRVFLSSPSVDEGDSPTMGAEPGSGPWSAVSPAPVQTSPSNGPEATFLVKSPSSSRPWQHLARRSRPTSGPLSPSVVTGHRYRGDVTSAQLVIEARKRAGLSQEALAKRLGVSRSTVTRWERRETQPNCDSLLRVFEACELDLQVRVVPRDIATRRMLDAQARLSPDELIDQLTAWASGLAGAKEDFGIAPDPSWTEG